MRYEDEVLMFTKLFYSVNLVFFIRDCESINIL